jgi:hypothetical protein
MRSRLAMRAAAAAALALGVAAQRPYTCLNSTVAGFAMCDASLPVAERVADLMARLSALNDTYKFALLSSWDGAAHVPQLAIPGYQVSVAPGRVSAPSFLPLRRRARARSSRPRVDNSRARACAVVERGAARAGSLSGRALPAHADAVRHNVPGAELHRLQLQHLAVPRDRRGHRGRRAHLQQ